MKELEAIDGVEGFDVPPRVLIVDDEESIRFSLRVFLEAEGYIVKLAAHAEDALEVLGAESFDVLITDIFMPGLSGVELLSQLQQTHPHLPVLLITGDPSVQTAVDALRSGATDYLSKPIDRAGLLKAVRQAAVMKRMHDCNALLQKQNRAYRENLENMVQDRTEKLRLTVQGIIEAMSKLVEVRDPYTAGHERNVANLAKAIAVRLGKSTDFIDTVYYAGLVHDLGKISVPSEILSFPGKLTDEVMVIVRLHPETAYQILHKVDFPWPLADVVRQHHERLDGSGYPLGLRGDDICEEARILAVADVVESMASHRPYRASCGLDAALAEIQSYAGTHYDENIVAACVELFREDGYTIQKMEEE
jgi:response regulator RpfG family c-di-GMP phosphodiesterase